jgi:malonyl CoA-acyl carrier protein transacylase
MTTTSGNLAILFCGQGVSVDGERDLVAETRPDLIDLATELVGADPFERAGQGTRYAQPAIYCAQIARFDALGRPEAALHAGHSLGELAALATAGALDDLDGLRMAVVRGRLMDAAAQSSPGGMLAVGCEREDALALVDETGLSLANENSPQQFVLSGPADRIERAEARARANRIRVKRLAVNGAFHSPQMEPAVAKFREALDAIEVHSPDVSVISGVTARPFGSDPRPALADALVSPVGWVDVLRRLSADGARRFLDVGPGKVLAGLVRKTLEGADAVTVKELLTHV